MSLAHLPMLSGAIALGFALAVALFLLAAHRVLSHVLAPDPEDDAPTPAVPQPGDHHA